MDRVHDFGYCAVAQCPPHAQAEEPEEKQIVTAFLVQQSAPSGRKNTYLTQPFPILFKDRSTLRWQDEEGHFTTPVLRTNWALHLLCYYIPPGLQEGLKRSTAGGCLLS